MTWAAKVGTIVPESEWKDEKPTDANSQQAVGFGGRNSKKQEARV